MPNSSKTFQIAGIGNFEGDMVLSFPAIDTNFYKTDFSSGGGTQGV
jgi:hypothetical protein